MQEDYCHAKYTGRRPLVDLAEEAGVLQLPSSNPIELEIEAMNLTGKNGVWGSSMVLLGPGRERICATLLPDSRQLKVTFAKNVRSIWIKFKPRLLRHDSHPLLPAVCSS